jgi:hypothetical protein
MMYWDYLYAPPARRLGPLRVGWNRNRIALVGILAHDLLKISQRAYRAVVIECKKLHHHDTRYI